MPGSVIECNEKHPVWAAAWQETLLKFRINVCCSSFHVFNHSRSGLYFIVVPMGSFELTRLALVALAAHVFVLLGQTAYMCCLAPALTGTAGKSHLWARLSVFVCSGVIYREDC